TTTRHPCTITAYYTTSHTSLLSFFFFFNATATTEIYTTTDTLSLHDALPISAARPGPRGGRAPPARGQPVPAAGAGNGAARSLPAPLAARRRGRDRPGGGRAGARHVRRDSPGRPLALDPLGRRVPARAAGAGSRTRAPAPRARRADGVARPAARDGAV